MTVLETPVALTPSGTLHLKPLHAALAATAVSFLACLWTNRSYLWEVAGLTLAPCSRPLHLAIVLLAVGMGLDRAHSVLGLSVEFPEEVAETLAMFALLFGAWRFEVILKNSGLTSRSSPATRTLQHVETTAAPLYA